MSSDYFKVTKGDEVILISKTVDKDKAKDHLESIANEYNGDLEEITENEYNDIKRRYMKDE